MQHIHEKKISKLTIQGNVLNLKKIIYNNCPMSSSRLGILFTVVSQAPKIGASK